MLERRAATWNRFRGVTSDGNKLFSRRRGVLIWIHQTHIVLVIRVRRIVDITTWNVVEPKLEYAHTNCSITWRIFIASREATPSNVLRTYLGKIRVDVILPFAYRELQAGVIGKVRVGSILVGATWLPQTCIPVGTRRYNILEGPFISFLLAAWEPLLTCGSLIGVD